MNPPMSHPKIEILPLKKGFLRAAADATHVLVRLVSPAKPADLGGAVYEAEPEEGEILADLAMENKPTLNFNFLRIR